MSAVLTLPDAFDWKQPDYASVIGARVQRLRRLREGGPRMLAALRLHYASDPASFISDFGMTADPRNVELGLPAEIPFLLFPKQVEWVTWILERWRLQQPGITDKSRETGVSWLSIALACTLCLFHNGMVIGFGSRKEELVDKVGSPQSLFDKARFFLSRLPPEFTGGWDRDSHAPHMRILFPSTNSAIIGESGDSIGRGSRCSIFFVDEAAFLEHPEVADAALSATTRCRQDISTPNGYANSFAQRRHSGKIPVFTFHWRDDPRKDAEWYAKQCDILDPVTLASEVDISYSGSVEGVLIPSAWVQAAVDAHIKLGIEPSGVRRAGLDIADEGRDENCLAMRYGIVLEHLESWSGKGSDLYASVVRAFRLCDDHGYKYLHYDADGLGSGVRGDARVINEARQADGRPAIADSPFRGSGAVERPEWMMVAERRNKDFFANLKAQAWWALRLRFQATWRAIVKGLPYFADDLISLPSTLPELTALMMELSQPTYRLNSVGKVLVEKTPDGAKSPNRGDALMIAYSPASHLIEMWTKLGAAE